MVGQSASLGTSSVPLDLGRPCGSGQILTFDSYGHENTARIIPTSSVPPSIDGSTPISPDAAPAAMTLSPPTPCPYRTCRPCGTQHPLVHHSGPQAAPADPSTPTSPSPAPTEAAPAAPPRSPPPSLPSITTPRDRSCGPLSPPQYLNSSPPAAAAAAEKPLLPPPTLLMPALPLMTPPPLQPPQPLPTLPAPALPPSPPLPPPPPPPPTLRSCEGQGKSHRQRHHQRQE